MLQLFIENAINYQAWSFMSIMFEQHIKLSLIKN